LRAFAGRKASVLAGLGFVALCVLLFAGLADPASAQKKKVVARTPARIETPAAKAAAPDPAADPGDDDSGGDVTNPDASEETLDSGGGDDVDNPGGEEPVAEPAKPSVTGIEPPSGGDNAPFTPNITASFELVARLTDNGAPITDGVTWRVFSPEPGPDGKLKLIAEAHGGSMKFTLTSGPYLVHAAYGRAGATKKIIVGGEVESDTVNLNAGGLRLLALAGKDQPLAPTDVSFNIYAPDEDGAEERILLVPNAPAGRVIGLNAGTYHVVCRYGDANAVVRADIRVEPGKLTEAQVYQKAARLTLKLVGEHGGEALADTSWSVVTPSGDSIADSVGAFPSVVLAVGDYTAIAKHDGKIYERNFTVEAGVNHDIEVIAK